MIKARNVIEKEPERFKKRPNLGTSIDNRPVLRTTTVLYTMLLN
jgi:hypothetical protein